jgi:E3 ubiquitin-protein ligase RNFT1
MQRERKIPVLVGITILFVVHVSGFYWCYKNEDLIRPLMMLPPKEIPPFWHAIFIILVNGMVFVHIYILSLHWLQSDNADAG